MVMSGIPLDGHPTTLVTSLVGGAAADAKADLVNLQLEVSPIERPDMDITVKAALRPIQITYDFVSFCPTKQFQVHKETYCHLLLVGYS